MRFIIRVSRFEDADYVVSMRSEDQQVWEDIPVGPVCTKQQAESVKVWLEHGGLSDLAKVGRNVNGEAEAVRNAP